MEAGQTKICTKCGRELPFEKFGKGNTKDGRRTWCKDCMNKYAREHYRSKKITSTTLNPDLAKFTPQELISELRARGYMGTLTFTEVKVHKIVI